VTRKTRQNLLRWAGHAGALIPLLLLAGDFYAGQLGADPVREITLRTGKAALVLLTLSLAVTPLKIWLGWTLLHPLRRILGLYAFLYVALHLLIFVYLDYGLNPRLLREALFEKPYALVGLAAFLILLPLAATSSRWAMRRMGKRWTRLHRWVYLAAGLALLHYFLLVKNAYTQPLLFALVIGALLLSRWAPVKQQIIRGRRRIAREWAARAARGKAPGN
jgi:methionine sulfoxide reductase heme-binding subunit